MKKEFCCFLAILFFIPLIVQASLIDELNKQIIEQEQKRAELKRQAQKYQQIINQKRSQIKSLKNQIAIFDAQISKLIIEIELTEEDISQTAAEIKQLEYGLEQTRNEIDYQKDNLAKIIQKIAEYDQLSGLEIVLQSGSFSDFFNQIVYLENLQQGVQQKVEALRFLKNKLVDDKQSKEEKKESLERLKSQLTSQKQSLAYQKNAKKSLLKYTQGEESKYQQLLAKVEAQKKSILGDLNRLRQLKAAELARLKEMQERPSSQYWASTSWYYRQNDPAWAKTTIGLTNSEMEDYGCAVTALAMIFSYYGAPVSPGRLAKEPIYYYDLIVWPQRWGSISCINCPPPHTSLFDWGRLDRELGSGRPVIVFIRANGQKAGHYVVVHHKTADGRYVVHDPLFGPNIYLDSSRVYISTLYQTTTSLDQMIIYH